MTDTLVDTSVILDIAEAGAAWRNWAGLRLANAADAGGLLINQVIYFELVVGYAAREDLDAAIGAQRFRRENLPWDAAFTAGATYLSYRKRGGPRTSPLPDLDIGAHAAVCRYRLLTRDRGCYRNHFAGIDIISPEMQP